MSGDTTSSRNLRKDRKHNKAQVHLAKLREKREREHGSPQEVEIPKPIIDGGKELSAAEIAERLVTGVPREGFRAPANPSRRSRGKET